MASDTNPDITRNLVKTNISTDYVNFVVFTVLLYDTSEFSMHVQNDNVDINPSVKSHA